MDNPVLVEVTRGAEVESRHRGAVSVVDAEGTAVAAVGDGRRDARLCDREGRERTLEERGRNFRSWHKTDLGHLRCKRFMVPD